MRPLLAPHRRLEHGHYNRLMNKLLLEDEYALSNYVQMALQLFDELMLRIMLVIQKQHGHLQEPLEAGLKLALDILKYPTLQYCFRCRNSMVGVIVQKVCQALVTEVMDEVMPLL